MSKTAKCKLRKAYIRKNFTLGVGFMFDKRCYAKLAGKKIKGVISTYFVENLDRNGVERPPECSADRDISTECMVIVSG